MQLLKYFKSEVKFFIFIRDLKKYECPVIIIEGKEDIFLQRKIHPNVIHGMISTIIIDYKIPIVYTKNPTETAQLMSIISKYRCVH